ncbi:phosphatidylinositol 3-kinase catalytic subunit type 3 [Anaeramoeba flamelloides]|uniref:Phosphatidylinositol 3-kinase catalytic subunit type 3 n=1 Tax=Anaeramoeba flamelloides TaxID=1746091 RepID=A0ABQ8YG36_9EUKA|nr:phosphatidylinositol 3-kinase catalytic subunit type 3 [Anaeramoeba flamelloides]
MSYPNEQSLKEEQKNFTNEEEGLPPPLPKRPVDSKPILPKRVLQVNSKTNLQKVDQKTNDETSSNHYYKSTPLVVRKTTNTPIHKSNSTEQIFQPNQRILQFPKPIKRFDDRQKTNVNKNSNQKEIEKKQLNGNENENEKGGETKTGNENGRGRGRGRGILRERARGARTSVDRKRGRGRGITRGRGRVEGRGIRRVRGRGRAYEIRRIRTYSLSPKINQKQTVSFPKPIDFNSNQKTLDSSSYLENLKTISEIQPNFSTNHNNNDSEQKQYHPRHRRVQSYSKNNFDTNFNYNYPKNNNTESINHNSKNLNSNTNTNVFPNSQLRSRSRSNSNSHKLNLFLSDSYARKSKIKIKQKKQIPKIKTRTHRSQTILNNWPDLNKRISKNLENNNKLLKFHNNNNNSNNNRDNNIKNTDHSNNSNNNVTINNDKQNKGKKIKQILGSTVNFSILDPIKNKNKSKGRNKRMTKNLGIAVIIPQKKTTKKNLKLQLKFNKNNKNNTNNLHLPKIKDPYFLRLINLPNYQMNAQPTKEEEARLTLIIQYPPIQELTEMEKNLVWRFREHFIQKQYSLPKFLSSVDFKNEKEIEEMKRILKMYDEESKNVQIVIALELLSKKYQHQFIREYAVSRLEKCSDELLQLYLLQIVQGLRYEESEKSSLANFLIERAVKNSSLANFFYWFVGAERKDLDFPIFCRVHLEFARRCLEHSKDSSLLLLQMQAQEELILLLDTLCQQTTEFNKNRKKKIHYMKSLIKNSEKYLPLREFEFPISLPLNPNKSIFQVHTEKLHIFKSALHPALFNFILINGDLYPVIFKRGDDLRQDQLVLQLITIMDQLMKDENLDLQMTVYSVISNSPDIGMVEFVKARPLASVLKENDGKLTNYFKKVDPDKTTENGFSHEIMNNYVRSCAGYSVITYLLGVGDRHLDNLLISESGKLLHVDFGYILGHDPKPFPPPMKLCKEMVEAMGGMKSKNYLYFKTLCGDAYTILRKHSHLLINLLTLMIDANIPDIDRDPKGTISKMQEKFRLDLSDEEAVEYILQVIDESVGALFAVVVEKLHSWAQYCKYFFNYLFIFFFFRI